MPYQLPDGYTIYGESNNGQTLTALRSGHTAGKPLMLIIDRQEASYNAQNGKYSVPTYRVRVIRGTLNAEGAPQAERLLVDATIRQPVGSEAEVDELMTDFVGFVSQADFALDGVQKHLFPDEYSV